ncbi:hypothetical protein [Saccharothrix sp. Mg75]|uniref:hypothetical protein n=1 Tax=Saccharothrix sp. Mg75 TaxID=3445357 RepID=UPI003EE993B4
MAFYERLDEGRFASTPHTSGPWSGESQHLGPPSALLVRAVEWRSVGGAFGPGDAVVWARPRVPVVAGEEPTALQRLFAIADSAGGVSSRLDVAKWYSINTDLTVHPHREPVGEWFALDARTVIGPAGVGVATSELHDESGPVGRGAQSLFVRER